MYALINGYLFRDAERKTSKAGTSYVKAIVKQGRGDETIFATVMAFRDAAEALMTAKRWRCN
jgi:hypothetical protein